jgi:predicted O-methyltransferase YrrM
LPLLERVRDHVGTLPYMTFAQAERLHGFLLENRLRDCLELGFFHGVSSAYIAEILKEHGSGHLVTIDLESAREREPNIEQILDSLGLQDLVTIHYEPHSYTWRLMKLIEAHPAPIFDFCYIDGGHTWDPTGFGFFLVEKLLRPNGWILLDDLNWTIGNSSTFRSGTSRRRYTPEELVTPQVRKVWELLVKRHPAFTAFREEGEWGFAQKREL